MKARHDRGHRQPPREVQRERESGEIVYGLRAVLAIAGARPDDVLRVGATAEATREAPGLFAELRARGVRVSDLPVREIERIAGSPQHEGIVLEAKPRRWASSKELAEILTSRKGTCIALDRVRNSYNVGAILRSAAFFGVDAVLLGAPAPHPGLDPNAVRVAEGGAEHVVMARTTDLADTLERLRQAGVRVYGADGRATSDAMTTRFARPSVLVLGNEREGMGPRVRAVCDELVAVRGTGAIESLNVGVAAGVLCARLTSR